jgi:bifunctional UDP-N-acetylglucosamine pyrophosphorylase/glucosamine-1-phosphate N-acetyltransferase
MSYVGDSILGHNVSLGGGTSLGNLRFDEEEIISMVKDEKIATGLRKFGSIIGNNCRTGVNTSILPGIKIGENSLLSAGLVIDQDIPNNSFVKPEKSHAFEIVENNKDVVGIEKREEVKKGL